MQVAVPTWFSIGLQVLSALVSIIAVIKFLRSGQEVKVEQAKAMLELTHSVQALADAQTRMDDKVDDALEESKKAHDLLWKRIDEIREKQTTLCTLHTVNHPGQAL